jgi:tryptophan 7-halogenase
LHYVANDRVGDPFWDHCRTMDIPPTLAEKIALFREAGAFVREQDELFLDESWGQVMIGQGILPQGWSPLADNVPAEDVGPFLESLASAYQTKARQLPTHADFIAHMLGSIT